MHRIVQTFGSNKKLQRYHSSRESFFRQTTARVFRSFSCDILKFLNMNVNLIYTTIHQHATTSSLNIGEKFIRDRLL